MKTCKISCRKVKISISPQGGNFQFSARGERYVYLKKIHLEISPRLRVTCLLDSDLKSAWITLLKLD